MNAAILLDHTLRSRTEFMRLLCPLLILLLWGNNQTAYGQRTASAAFGAILDEVGIMVNGTFIPGPQVTAEQLAGNPALFENHSPNHLPILKPDGTTPVKYNDITGVTGTLTVVELGQPGTRVTISVDGLLPGGRYTVWSDLYQFPGFTPDFAHELGVGALGYDSKNPPQNPIDYVGNVITADANGHGELEVVQPPGPLSWYATPLVDNFEVPAYVLTDPVYEFHTLLAYHLDGKSWGPRPGKGEALEAFDETWVSLGDAFVAVPEPSSLILALSCLPLLRMCAHRRKRQ